MADRTYPLRPKPAEDPRFTLGLFIDVAAVLTAAGYPKLTSQDHVELGQALYRFLYVGEER